MSIIPNHKIGVCHCGECSGANVAGRKVGKRFYCMTAYNKMKTQEQFQKAIKRDTNRKALITDSRKLRKEDAKPLSGISSLIQDLDYVVSRYVRISAADKEGVVQCYTCPAKFHWTLIHCGHFINRTHLSTRFDTNNLRCQCISCNSFNKGNIEVYAANLEKDNPGVVEYLQEQAKVVYKPTQFELKELLISFRAKLKIVESKLKSITDYPLK
jgi:hypothetical protein